MTPTKARPASSKKEAPSESDDLIRILAIKGSAQLDAVAAAMMSKPDKVQQSLNTLMKQGLIERVAGALRLSPKGKAKSHELLAADRKSWGTKNASAALDAFHPLDQRMKETVTAWQLRSIGGEQVLNDHSDPIYDRRVLGQLAALHQDVSEWLAGMKNAPRSIAQYRARLDRAMQSARQDGRFIASPAVDSYHGVWFELHEALIQLAGRKRAAESAAGRA